MTCVQADLPLLFEKVSLIFSGSHFFQITLMVMGVSLFFSLEGSVLEISHHISLDVHLYDKTYIVALVYG
jgi:hypothetical protein